MSRIGALPSGIDTLRPTSCLHSASDDDSTACPADSKEQAARMRSQSSGGQPGSTLAIQTAHRHLLDRSALLASHGDKREQRLRKRNERRAKKDKTREKRSDTDGRYRQLH